MRCETREVYTYLLGGYTPPCVVLRQFSRYFGYFFSSRQREWHWQKDDTTILDIIVSLRELLKIEYLLQLY